MPLTFGGWIDGDESYTTIPALPLDPVFDNVTTSRLSTTPDGFGNGKIVFDNPVGEATLRGDSYDSIGFHLSTASPISFPQYALSRDDEISFTVLGLDNLNNTYLGNGGANAGEMRLGNGLTSSDPIDDYNGLGAPSSYPAVKILDNKVTFKNLSTFSSGISSTSGTFDNSLYLANNSTVYSDPSSGTNSNNFDYCRYLSFDAVGRTDQGDLLPTIEVKLQRLASMVCLTLSMDQNYTALTTINSVVIDSVDSDILPSWAIPDREIQNYGVVWNKNSGLPVKSRIIVRVDGTIAFYFETNPTGGNNYRLIGTGLSYIV